MKIKPFIKYCRSKWKFLFSLGENIVIYESIACFKGRLIYKQYCKDKIVKQAMFIILRCIQVESKRIKVK